MSPAATIASATAAAAAIGLAWPGAASSQEAGPAQPSSATCRHQGLDADDPSPQTVGLYLATSADEHGIDKVAVSTIERRLSAICAAYRSAGTPLDRGDRHIGSVMAGIRRTHARPPRQKEAVLGEDLLAMLATLPVNLRGIRDRAILLLGFAGALRRSEIVGLDCGPGETGDGGG